jgi:hypothetical protein
MDEQERVDRDADDLDEGAKEALAESVLEGPGADAPRSEVAGKADAADAGSGGRLDDLDEVAQAARSAEDQQG